MPSVTVELSSQAELVLEGGMMSGAFADESQFVNEAILSWHRRDFEAKRALLKERLAEGIAQYERGEFVDASIDEIMLEIDRELEAHDG